MRAVALGRWLVGACSVAAVVATLGWANPSQAEEAPPWRFGAGLVGGLMQLNEVGSIALELGPVVGAGVNVFSSSRCEDETYFSFYFGGQGGLAVRFGSRDQYMVEAHAIMHTAPSLRCANFGRGKTAAVYHERDFETVGGAVTLGSLL